QMPLAMIHANNEDAWNEAAQAVRRAVTLSESPVTDTPLIYRRISE
ncbi:thymidine phosphorylase, partial [Escherichia coli]|nr:thymidine phosphorylase [Escherichia coli]